ncbi:hypothetical protein A245_10907, partial [Pseudomonas syringae pv. actinidiae ICMP 19096]
SVDRTRLNAGETVELTLETDDVTQFGKPDMSSLEASFEVRDTRQLNSLKTLDGSSQATTRWIVTLLPRETGSVIIPSLQLGELKSQPLTLQVMQSETKEPTSHLASIFIEASLDQDSVYVQAQAVLTLRVYHSVSLFDDSSLSPLQVPDARVEKLGDARTYEKLINGVRHGVIETRYAIYPQQSGVLTIPSQVKSVRVKSAEVPLTVKPKPANYPADVAWLPARSISLEENWSPEPGTTQVGDSLTRTITLKAEGLAGAQLPP